MPAPNHVDPGGDPLVLRLSATVTATKLSVGPMDNNAYLLQAGGGATVLLDAADDADRLLRLIGDGPVDTIVTTHRHPDHWQALAAVAEATGAHLVAGRPDAEAIASDAGVSGVQPVWDGDTISLGEEELVVVGLVGHTPGSITLAYAGDGSTHLFTGDSLFPGGPGKTWSPGDFVSLMDDLERKIFGAYADDAVVHRGTATARPSARPAPRGVAHPRLVMATVCLRPPDSQA